LTVSVLAKVCKRLVFFTELGVLDGDDGLSNELALAWVAYVIVCIVFHKSTDDDFFHRGWSKSHEAINSGGTDILRVLLLLFVNFHCGLCVI
jgi:hypothetical protein